MSQTRADIISQLQADIHRLEGFKPAKSHSPELVLGPIHQAFPAGTFPLGAVHEFLSAQTEDLAATSAFIAGLLAHMVAHHGATLWISSGRTVFPPALANYGLQPDKIIFVDVRREQDVMSVLHEALKCSAISAVVGETTQMDFTTSRRLQLAVEQSQVTGFVIRNHIRHLNTTACISRWKISSLGSEADEGLPGIGFPKWRVELLRMRNGKTGSWDVQWKDGRFTSIRETSAVKHLIADNNMHKKRKTG